MLNKTNILRLITAILLGSYGVFVWHMHNKTVESAEQLIRAEQALLRPPPGPAAIIRFDGIQKGLVVPYWQWTNVDRVWAYASPSQPIDPAYEPPLTPLPVTHGQWLPTKQVARSIEKPLQELFSAAEADGQQLIITSAYRSAQEQYALRGEYLQVMGPEWTATHVTQPGHGEHQLGLAVDISTFTPACELSFTYCHLTLDTTNWLKNNAHLHGFILRYPEGKSHITGISYEPWHYRYVGKEMARFIHESGLTFDEISQEIARQRSKPSDANTSAILES